ncbi:hypothetical protein RZP59_26300, partial [Citrobacter freundii]|nr:hypothetical protein [Citrobacter freundii]MDV0952445.1 hypothetical protein [Citrobacter freundii]MDV0957598.1 hypothetical protein [Citrobacter freundii]MDV0962740.1 hypothetical protein [Citrobacter freundii]MEB0476587.1 hypothetical protein [Citrobacter freundii]
KACVLPENPASYRVVRTKSYLFNKAQLQQQICGDYHLGDIHLFYPGASLGVVEIDPLETDVNFALHLADSAMYKDKKRQDKTAFVVH